MHESMSRLALKGCGAMRSSGLTATEWGRKYRGGNKPNASERAAAGTAEGGRVLTLQEGRSEGPAWGPTPGRDRHSRAHMENAHKRDLAQDGDPNRGDVERDPHAEAP